MNTYRFIIITILSVCSLAVFAQKNILPNDSIMNSVKIKELTEKKTKLKKQIALEDNKRNQVINGVKPEFLEEMNDKQDAICLDLRSQLVAVELELQELLPDKTAQTIVNQLNLLNHNPQPNIQPVTQGTTSGK